MRNLRVYCEGCDLNIACQSTEDIRSYFGKPCPKCGRENLVSKDDMKVLACAELLDALTDFGYALDEPKLVNMAMEDIVKMNLNEVFVLALKAIEEKNG